MKSKKKRIPILKIIVLFILMLVFLFCSYQCYTIWKDYHDSETSYLNIRERYVNVPDKGERIEENGCPVTFKQIDWDGLKEANRDIVGWIEIPDTVVDYPIMHHETIPDYYLYRNFEGKRYSAGSIFMETLNKSDFSDKNTIIYGHNMKNGSMFSCLKKYLKEDFAAEHPYVIIYTPDKNYVYHVMNAFISVSDGPMYEVWFEDITYENWLENMKKTAVKGVGEDFDAGRKTITLSTCHGKSGTQNRMILQLQETNY